MLLSCRICNTKFKSLGYLNRHLQAHIKCEICGFTQCGKFAYNQHMKKCISLTKKQCNNKLFVNQSIMAAHVQEENFTIKTVKQYKISTFTFESIEVSKSSQTLDELMESYVLPSNNVQPKLNKVIYQPPTNPSINSTTKNPSINSNTTNNIKSKTSKLIYDEHFISYQKPTNSSIKSTKRKQPPNKIVRDTKKRAVEALIIL